MYEMMNDEYLWTSVKSVGGNNLSSYDFDCKNKNRKNTLWWANSLSFDVACLYSVYVSELTTHCTANRHQCRFGTCSPQGKNHAFG